MKRAALLSLPFALAILTSACGDDGTSGTAADTAREVSTSLFDTPPSQPDADTAAPPDTTTAPDTTSSDAAADGSTLADTAQDTGADTSKLPDTTTPDASGTPDVAAEVVTDVVAPPQEVRFIVMGDQGTGSDTQKVVADAVAAKCAADGCDFALLCGDNVYDAGVESTMDALWQSHFETPYAAIDMPFYAVLGNHDNGGFLSQLLGDTFGGAGAEFERGDYQVDYTQLSTKWTMPARFYDFMSGPAHFFALDTNDMVWRFLNDGAETRTQAQIAMVPAAMDSSPATWKIAFGHHPVYSNGQHGDAGAYEGLEEGVTDLIGAIPFLGSLGELLDETVTGDGVQAGLDTILCGHTDLYFSGHDHNRQWIPEVPACPGVTFVVSGAGAKVKDFRQSSNTTLYQDDQNEGFFYIHISGNQLNAQAVDADGSVAWSTQLVK